MFEYLTYLVNWTAVFVNEFMFHAVRDWWNLGYFVRDFWMGNY